MSGLMQRFYASVTGRYAFWWLLLFNSLLFVALVHLIPWYYETNDDIAMAWIASGRMSGTPDGHLVFINILYGRLLSLLYGWWPRIEWYTLLFSIFHVVSQTMICNEILRRVTSIKIRLAAYLLTVVFLAQFVVTFQFTRLASFMAIAAFSFLSSADARKWLFGALWLLVAVQIRFHAAMSVAMVFVAFYPWHIRKFGFRKSQFVCLCLCAVLSLGLKVYDYRSYQTDPEWSYFQKYNHLRGRLNDNPNFKYVYGCLPEGISKNDFLLFFQFYADPDIMTLEKLQQLDALVERIPRTKKMDNIANLLYLWRDYAWPLAFFGLLCVGLMVQSRKNCWLLLPLAVICVAIMLVALDGYVKNRVFFGIFYAFVVFLLLYASHLRSTKWQLPLVASVVGLSLSWGCICWRLVSQEDRSVLEEQTEMLAQLPEGSMVSSWFAAMRHDLLPPMRVSSYYPIPVRGRGWLTASPLLKDVSSYKCLVEGGMYLLAERRTAGRVCNRIRQALYEHYGVRTRVNVATQNDDYVIFNFCDINRQ